MIIRIILMPGVPVRVVVTLLGTLKAASAPDIVLARVNGRAVQRKASLSSAVGDPQATVSLKEKE